MNLDKRPPRLSPLSTQNLSVGQASPVLPGVSSIATATANLSVGQASPVLPGVSSIATAGAVAASSPRCLSSSPLPSPSFVKPRFEPPSIALVSSPIGADDVADSPAPPSIDALAASNAEVKRKQLAQIAALATQDEDPISSIIQAAAGCGSPESAPENTESGTDVYSASPSASYASLGTGYEPHGCDASQAPRRVRERSSAVLRRDGKAASKLRHKSIACTGDCGDESSQQSASPQNSRPGTGDGERRSDDEQSPGSFTATPEEQNAVPQVRQRASAVHRQHGKQAQKLRSSFRLNPTDSADPSEPSIDIEGADADALQSQFFDDSTAQLESTAGTEPATSPTSQPRRRERAFATVRREGKGAAKLRVLTSCSNLAPDLEDAAEEPSRSWDQRRPSAESGKPSSHSFSSIGPSKSSSDGRDVHFCTELGELCESTAVLPCALSCAAEKEKAGANAPTLSLLPSGSTLSLRQKNATASNRLLSNVCDADPALWYSYLFCCFFFSITLQTAGAPTTRLTLSPSFDS